MNFNRKIHFLFIFRQHTKFSHSSMMLFWNLSGLLHIKIIPWIERRKLANRIEKRCRDIHKFSLKRADLIVHWDVFDFMMWRKWIESIWRLALIKFFYPHNPSNIGNSTLLCRISFVFSLLFHRNNTIWFIVEDEKFNNSELIKWFKAFFNSTHPHKKHPNMYFALDSLLLFHIHKKILLRAMMHLGY